MCLTCGRWDKGIVCLPRTRSAHPSVLSVCLPSTSGWTQTYSVAEAGLGFLMLLLSLAAQFWMLRGGKKWPKVLCRLGKQYANCAISPTLLEQPHFLYQKLCANQTPSLQSLEGTVQLPGSVMNCFGNDRGMTRRRATRCPSSCFWFTQTPQCPQGDMWQHLPEFPSFLGHNCSPCFVCERVLLRSSGWP